MTVKAILLGNEALSKLQDGLNKLADPVKSTLGPKGRNVAIGQSVGSPKITNDGVSIAKEIELEDVFERIGADLVKEVTKKTDDVAGDGTTTATVIAQSIVNKGLSYVISGIDPLAIKRGIDKAVELICKRIDEISVKISTKEQIASTASISSADSRIGNIIADAMDKVGRDGVITVEDGNAFGFHLELTEGMKFDKGYTSPYFITDQEAQETVFENPLILLISSKLSNLKESISILEKVMQSGRPLLIIAENVEGEVLATLVFNKIRGTLKVAAVKSPGFGDRRKAILEDIAVLVGGKIVDDEIGVTLENIDIDDLGSARKVIITKNNTTIIDGKGSEDAISRRATQITKEIKKTDSSYDKEKLQERLASLTGGIAVIKVGGATEIEVNESKHRVEDAIRNAQAAVEDGIVAGGGVALLRAAKLAENDIKGIKGDEHYGAEIVVKAIHVPLMQIVENAGENGSVVIHKLKSMPDNIGFNALTGEYVDMFEAKVIDPAKVTKSALRNASSVGGLFLTTDAVITEKPSSDDNDNNDLHGSHGMM